MGLINIYYCMGCESIRYVFTSEENIANERVKRASEWYFLREWKRIVCTSKPCNKMFITCTNYQLISTFKLDDMRNIHIFTAQQWKKSRMHVIMCKSCLKCSIIFYFLLSTPIICQLGFPKFLNIISLIWDSTKSFLRFFPFQ